MDVSIPKSIDSILAIAFCSVCFIFLFSYDHPLNVDFPFHASIAKAAADLFVSHASTVSNYPYEWNLQLSSYALPQILLATLMVVAGAQIGGKLALFLWMITYALTTNKVVRLLNGGKTPLAYVGYPLAFSYFFHWGFWPFMVGLTFANLCIIYDRLPDKKESLVRSAILRLFTFLCHPIPTLVVGVYDIVFTFFPQRFSLDYKEFLWKKMLIIWVPASTLLVWMMLGLSSDSAMAYDSIVGQIKALGRGITPWGGKLGIAIAGGSMLLCLLLVYRPFRIANRKVIICGLLFLLAGILIPRMAFMNSWGNSERIALFGIIFLLAAINLNNNNKWVLTLFVGVLFTANITYSVLSWNYFNNHVVKLVNFIETNPEKFEESNIKHVVKKITPYAAPDTNGLERMLGGILLGSQIDNWLWCLEMFDDVHNYVAQYPFGPTRYIGPMYSESETASFYYTHWATSSPLDQNKQYNVLYESDIYLVVSESNE